jgi:3-oxoacyl-[acyl-carrier-protein] synthase III
MNKPKVGFETIVNFLPEEVKTAKDQSYLYDVVPEVLKGSYRVPNEIRRLKRDDGAEFLAEKVAQKALDSVGLKPSDIGCIISNNFGGRFVWPMVGPYVHDKLGFPKEIPVFNLSNACASFLDASEMAWNFVLAGKYKRVLIVTAASWECKGGQGRTDLTDPMAAVFGDGAGAAIVSSKNLKCEFLSYYGQTFGEVYDYCAAEVRGPAHPEMKQAAEQPPISVYMFGTPQFFQWWQQVGEHYGIDSIRGALKNTKPRLKLSDLDLVIFHQPADILFDQWIEGAAKAGVPREKWMHTWDKYGNMGNCVVPVNLAEFWEQGQLKKGSIIALLAIGAGAHAPTMIVRWLAK